jgi:anion-transporting  ArsA/GET3 family ATPase
MMRRFAPTLKGLSLLMELHHFFTAQRVLIVAGKGGVGKSAVAGSLALLSAQSGLRTLLVSFDAQTIEIPDHERLEKVIVTPGKALTDYLASKGMGLISRQLAKSGIVELVATTAPGLDDLLVLGRIKAFEKELRADVIIVDGPAAGHAIDLVRAPLQLKRALATGPIAQQADEVLAMLGDGKRCQVLMVTTPAMTPVQETVEAATELRDDVHIVLAPVVVNKREADVPTIDTTGMSQELVDAHTYATQRMNAQRDAINTLKSSLNLPQLSITRRRLDGVELVNAIVEDLAIAIEALS